MSEVPQPPSPELPPHRPTSEMDWDSEPRGWRDAGWRPRAEWDSGMGWDDEPSRASERDWSAGIDERIPLIYGLRLVIARNKLHNVPDSARQIADDAQFYKDSALKSIQLPRGHVASNPYTNKVVVTHQHEPSVDELYDPMDSFGNLKKTMKPYGRIGLDETLDRAVDKGLRSEREIEPRTPRQMRRAVNNNLKGDAITKNDTNQDRLVSVYGDILYDENAVEARIRDGRYSRKEAGNLRKASQHVRNAQRSSDRIGRRLERRANGRDPRGRLLRFHAGNSDNTIRRLEEKVTRLENGVPRAIEKHELRVARRRQLQASVGRGLRSAGHATRASGKKVKDRISKLRDRK